jgi:OmpA-OmpF porin, OOP family
MSWAKVRALALPAFLFASSLGEASAHAQSTGFSLDRFDPAPAGSQWFVLDSLDMRGRVRPAFELLGDYSYRSLALYNADGSTKTVIVGDQLFLHAAASLVLFDRLRLAFDLPLAVFQHGNTASFDGVTYQGPNKPALGDLRLDADVRLFGEYGGPITMALGSQLFVPTGSRTLYTGDGAVRVAPHVLVAGELGIFAYAASVGLVVHAEDQAYAGTPVGGELTLSGAAGLLLADKHLLIGPEVWGRTDITNGGAAFTRNNSPVEGLLGVHGMTTSGFRFGVGGGSGFAQGLGSPAARVIASIAYSPPPDVSHDRDGDGIVDEKDACPDQPGVRTDDPATNGCPEPPPPPPPPPVVVPPPDPDRDKDGILNEVDACPDTPGEPDPDPSKNGCPKATVEHGAIKIIDQVKFKTDSAEILSESDGILMAVKKILTNHPEIKRVDIEGHTDNRGPAAHNQDLSQRRAAAVQEWLVARDIDKARLTSHGFGQTRPIDSNNTEAGRQNNRRVEFHIVESRSASTSPTEGDRKAVAASLTSAVVVVDAPEDGASPAPTERGPGKRGPGKDGGSGKENVHAKKAHAPDKSKVDLGATASALGAYDTNIFDKGANPVSAAGLDVTAGLTLGVPVSPRVSWINGVGVGTNYRDGISGSVGDANALRVDAHARTGIEALLAGRTSLAGRKVKKGIFPAVKLTLEAKYALWANPLITQPPKLDDESIDALEPSDDDSGSDSSGGGGDTTARSERPRRYAQADSSTASDGAPSAGEGGGDDSGNEGDEAEPAEVSAGPQTFSNPNLHNKVTGIAKLSLETSKKWSFGLDGTFGRDFVDLDDNVEVSPEYDEITAGLSARCKIAPKVLWITAGYVFERRFYDEPSAGGASQDFFVQGGKLQFDLPFKVVKLKLSYDARLKFADAGSAKNATRNQVQLGAEVPLGKVFSAVAETRFTYTIFDGPANSTRFIGLAGLKVKL